eukprot:8549143-Alexandrium_andersonii.AAC.1
MFCADETWRDCRGRYDRAAAARGEASLCASRKVRLGPGGLFCCLCNRLRAVSFVRSPEARSAPFC